MRRRSIPFVPGSAGRFRVACTPLAYPVFLAEYEADRRRFEQGTGAQRRVRPHPHGKYLCGAPDADFRA